jgi:hypothetical protein
MIADQIFWPRLLLIDFDMDEAQMYHAIDEAVLTILARHSARHVEVSSSSNAS